VDPKNSIFTVLNKIICAIRDQIIASPGINQATATEIASTTKLEEDQVAQAFYTLFYLGVLPSGGLGIGGEKIASLSLSEYEYDEYLRYERIEDLLEKFYKRLTPGPPINDVFERIQSGKRINGVRLD